MKRILSVCLLLIPSFAFAQVGSFQYEFDGENCRHCWKEEHTKLDIKKTPIFGHLQKQIKNLSDSQIEKLFKHNEPMVKVVALTVAGEKKLALSGGYTEALIDNHPSVRQAARQCLIVLAPGQDFGPPPTSTAVDGIIAHRMWSKYFKEPWTDRLCENQYDNYYFDSYQSKFILKTSQDDIPLDFSLKALDTKTMDVVAEPGWGLIQQ